MIHYKRTNMNYSRSNDKINIFNMYVKMYNYYIYESTYTFHNIMKTETESKKTINKYETKFIVSLEI